MMSPEFLTEVEDAFSEAAQLSPHARTEFLSRSYAGRPDIVREVESLLRHQGEADKRVDRAIIAAAAAEMLQDVDDVIGAVIGGRYLIRQRIGDGAHAEVYLADHIALKTPFALKRPRPALRGDADYRARFLEEARRAVLLKHDNVARVHDVINDSGDIFVVMEHVEGETLRARMNRLGRPLTVAEFLPIAMQCAAALAAAHEKRIVHLDVKPENIMLTPAGQVKICDFGVARRLAAENSNDTATKQDAAWTLAGTPAYMAPEVILSQNFDERADLFSLGTVFYEMLTGKNPFWADTVIATTAQVVTFNPPTITGPDIDKCLGQIITRLLAKEPERRHPSTVELLEDLNAFRRSRSRFQDLFIGFREAFTERRWMRATTVIAVLLIVLTPVGWVYRVPVQRWLGLYPPMPANKVVAVLPLRYTGSNHSTYYWEGLTDSLTSTLSRLRPMVQMIPASGVRTGNVTTTQQAWQLLGATLAVQGSVSDVGNDSRIEVTLFDTQSAKVLRYNSFLSRQSDAIAVEGQLIEAAIGLLEIELGPAELRRLKLPGTNSPEAYEYYLQGVGYIANRTSQDNEKAIQLFQKALGADVNFSLAYAGLGEAYLTNAIRGSRPPRLMDRSLEACEKAVELAANLAAGHVCVGHVRATRGEMKAAIESYERAVVLDPANDAAYRELARSLERLGNWEGAEATYQKAIDVRPDYWGNYIWLAAFYMFSRDQHKDAISLYTKAVSLVPNNPLPRAYLCGAHIAAGNYHEAIRSCNNSLALKPQVAAYLNLGVAYSALREFSHAADAFDQARRLEPSNYKAVGHLARALAWLPGRRDESSDLYLAAITLAGEVLKTDPADPDTNMMAARYHAMIGHRTEAMSHLQIALKERPKDLHYQEVAAVIHNQFGERTVAMGYLERAIAGGYSLTEIEAEIELDSLRADPRISALIANVRRKGTNNGQ
jgi:tetratricopeptide (TPR) repeat protein/tRNA A-37 threonylcarbamoyl transferase component Bud32